MLTPEGRVHRHGATETYRADFITMQISHAPVRNPSRSYGCPPNWNDQRIPGRCGNRCPPLFPRCIPRCSGTAPGIWWTRVIKLPINELDQIFLQLIARAITYLGDESSRLVPWIAPPHPLFAGSSTNSKSFGSSTAVYSIHNWLDVLVMLYGWALPQNLPISGDNGPPFLRERVKGIFNIETLSEWLWNSESS